MRWKRSNSAKEKELTMVTTQSFSASFFIIIYLKIMRIISFSAFLWTSTRDSMKKKWEARELVFDNTHSEWSFLLMRFDPFFPLLTIFHRKKIKTLVKPWRWRALEMIRDLDVYENKIYGFLSMKIAFRGERNVCELLENHWFR